MVIVTEPARVYTISTLKTYLLGANSAEGLEQAPMSFTNLDEEIEDASVDNNSSQRTLLFGFGPTFANYPKYLLMK